MTAWETKIIEAFKKNYFMVSKTDNRRVLRLRSSNLFPDFDTAPSGEKESFLEAAESLERAGIIKLTWEKHGKGERLKTLSCENFEKIFEATGEPLPATEAESISEMINAVSKKLSPYSSHKSTKAQRESENINRIVNLLEYLSHNFRSRDIGQGINQKIMADFLKLLEFCSKPEQLENITTRSLSILLYRDSKHLENVLAICNPLLQRAKNHIQALDFSFLDRVYPETMISGKIVIEYKNEKTPLINAGGHILGFPLENAEEISRIQPEAGEEPHPSDLEGNSGMAKYTGKIKKTVLTIENKETYYALGSPQRFSSGKNLSCYDCFLYVGGYSNRAAAAIIKILAACGFSFYHAGDLDPDGILILQHISDIAGKPVTPVRMDAATFDQYLPWARTLAKPMLSQIKKIRMDTRAIPELAGLLRRIEETGMGIEQEIVDYR